MTDPTSAGDPLVSDWGLTVGQLRKALEGIPDAYPVTLHVTHPETEDLIRVGIYTVDVEDNCGGTHLVLNGDPYEDLDGKGEE